MAPDQVGNWDLADVDPGDLAATLKTKTPNIFTRFTTAKLKYINATFGRSLHELALSAEEKDALTLDAWQQQLVQVNQAIVLTLQQTLFPSGRALADRVNLLRDAFFGPTIDALLAGLCDTSAWERKEH